MHTWTLSPGPTSSRRSSSSREAAAVLRRELSKPGYRCSPITLGSQHRRLAARRAAAGPHAPDPGGPAGVPPPCQRHHQVVAGGAGPGPAGRPGAGQPGPCARQRDDAGRRAEAPPGNPAPRDHGGASRRFAGLSAAGIPCACWRRR
ncbi:MAG: hypothetical protein MZV49_08825 [Rhodopseudomonas palustris]|nr:hypothetical protein [Rhodopseudomonas palustris]